MAGKTKNAPEGTEGCEVSLKDQIAALSDKLRGVLLGNKNLKLQPHEDVDDIVQETMLIAIEDQGKFDPKRSTLLTWLSQHIAINHVIKNSRLQPTNSYLRFEGDLEAADHREQEGQSEGLFDYLDQISPDDWSVLRPLFNGEITQRELAKQLGITEDAMRWRRAMFLRSARELLDQDEYDISIEGGEQGEKKLGRGYPLPVTIKFEGIERSVKKRRQRHVSLPAGHVRIAA